MAQDILTQEYLKSILHYSIISGLFTWLVDKSYQMKKGSRAGGLCGGYVHIKIDGVAYKAHRLAFLYVDGEIPAQADHDNHIKHDNRWLNLNRADYSINSKNKSLYKGSKSDVCGVTFHKLTGKWVANIKVNRVQKHLGLFDDIETAAIARRQAEREYGYHKNHGSKL